MVAGLDRVSDTLEACGAVIERDGDWYIAYCPEVPGANGQGRTKEETRRSLSKAIALVLEDRRAEGLRDVSPEAERKVN